MRSVLCVAEKPSVSKAIAEHLSGGTFQTHSSRSRFIKNYAFDFDFGPPWGPCHVTMTCVVGHVGELEFTSEYKNWEFPPPESLFNAPIRTGIAEDKKPVADNIEQGARFASALVIWTDCDLEGEHIGSEIRNIARRSKPNIEVKRARFSNIERAHIITAARRLGDLDEKQVNAVAARIELDLRVGFALTRLLTLSLRPLGSPLENVISYGPCQFPTLGFVVDRYFRVQNFKPEPFWSIKVTHHRKGINVNFSWARHRLFDRMSVIILFERCLAAKTAKVIKVQEKPTKRWKPLPLTTVELQKAATRLLRMTGARAMTIAEGLYNKGFISYPRTETDRFDKAINLRALVEKQAQDSRWGQFAQGLIGGGFQQPREGRHDDKAHPPIHPITYAAPQALTADEGKLYEYVVRRFLACCSEDAKGMATDVDILYGEEVFGAHGVIVLERNYLEVYVYEKWTGTVELPKFEVGEKFEPTEAMITEGKTSAPGYLTEADLIALMDANGIGTDATMAEHIEKVQMREYVRVVDSHGQSTEEETDDDNTPPARGGRGGRRARGTRGGRGGSRDAATGRGRGVRVFVPTRLGVALIVGLDRMDFETSLGKPFLRKEMEQKMKEICDGRITKDAVLQHSIGQYRRVFTHCQEHLDVLKAACREFLFSD